MKKRCKEKSRNKLRSNKYQKIILYMIAIAVILAVILAIIYVVVPPMFVSSNENSTVATINGESISVREFEEELKTNRAEVFSYFKQKYNIDDNSKFWTSTYNGEVPIELAKKKALDILTRTKVVEILAKQEGIIQDISYSTFLKNLKMENKRRSIAAKNNEVIYGPIQYQEEEYFNYLFSNMEINLKEKLWKGKFFTVDKGLKDYYNTAKDKLFKIDDSIKVQIIYIPLISKNNILDSSKKAAAKSRIEQIKSELEKGKGIGEIKKEYSDDDFIKPNIKEQVFGNTTAKSDSEEYPKLKAEAVKLISGQVSGVIEDNNAYNIIKCIEKKFMGYKPFDEVKDAVKSNYINEKYQKLIDELLKEVKIEVYKNVYNSVNIR